MTVYGRSLLLVSALICRAAAWTPQPQNYRIPLTHPAKDGRKTQLSLYPPDGPVKILSGADITSMLKSPRDHPVVVAMYASWCPHCWHLVPQWVMLASAFSGQDKDVEIAAVNCADAANREACDTAKVTAYPDMQCYGCPISSKCDSTTRCVVSIGFKTLFLSDSQWVAKWIGEATHGKVKPSHPDVLKTRKPGNHEVAIQGPPGKPGFIPSAYLTAAIRNTDAMRGFLSALWSKNDAKAAHTAVKFLVSLFGPSCCKRGDMPGSLRSAAITDLHTLASSLEGGPLNTREVLEKWAARHGINSLGNQESFATFEYGMLGSGGQDAFRTCTTFTCSLWTFLHLVTSSSAYFAEAGSPRLSPGEVMKFTSYFISEFMTCAACRHHFIASYESCEFERCKVDTQKDWKGLVIWMWRVHNGVSLRTAARDNAPVDRRWPSYEDCEGCWQPVTFGDAPTKNNFNLEEIGKHSLEIDKPFNLANTYRFIVASYVGYSAVPTADHKVLREWKSDQPSMMSPNPSRTWVWKSLCGVTVAGVAALIMLWRHSTMSARWITDDLLRTDDEAGE